MRAIALLLSLVLTLFASAGPVAAAMEEAVLAGGCFWCLEHDLESLPGVKEAISGYSGGHVANPTYRQVSAEGTGHQESVLVRFDNSRLAYATLLRAYWRNIDPFDGRGQFCDKGDSYRPVIFTADAAQAQQDTEIEWRARDAIGRFDPLHALADVDISAPRRTDR